MLNCDECRSTIVQYRTEVMTLEQCVVWGRHMWVEHEDMVRHLSAALTMCMVIDTLRMSNG